MLTLQNIKELIARGDYAAALRELDCVCEQTPADDVFVERGKLRWKLGMHSEAVTDYEHALSLNPANTQAHAALEMSRDIFNFFNPDLLNP